MQRRPLNILFAEDNAAHAKLEKLQLYPRELKEKYAQREAEIEIAVRPIGNLERELSDLDAARSMASSGALGLLSA